MKPPTGAPAAARPPTIMISDTSCESPRGAHWAPRPAHRTAPRGRRRHQLQDLLGCHEVRPSDLARHVIDKYSEPCGMRADDVAMGLEDFAHPAVGCNVPGFKMRDDDVVGNISDGPTARSMSATCTGKVPSGYVVSAATTAVAAAVQAEPRVLHGRGLCAAATTPAAAIPAAQGPAQYERTVGRRGGRPGMIL